MSRLTVITSSVIIDPWTKFVYLIVRVCHLCVLVSVVKISFTVSRVSCIQKWRKTTLVYPKTSVSRFSVKIQFWDPGILIHTKNSSLWNLKVLIWPKIVTPRLETSVEILDFPESFIHTDSCILTQSCTNRAKPCTRYRTRTAVYTMGLQV